jgi:poly(3-hydroxybutyrate) depolymerase
VWALRTGRAPDRLAARERACEARCGLESADSVPEPIVVGRKSPFDALSGRRVGLALESTVKIVSPSTLTASLAAALLACSSSSGDDATSYALNVTKAGTGTGTVTSTAGGIDCGTTCTASFASGTDVTLSASADTGSAFGGWGGACSGTGRCVLDMTADRSVVATFRPARYSLAVSKAGSGSGTVTSGSDIDCGFLCSGVYVHGTQMTLTATAASGSTFAGWSGACTGTQDCVVDMTAARVVTATFDGGGADAQPSAGCGRVRTLQNGTVTVESDGPRTYILRAPDDYDNTRPYRLVLAYHWRYADAQAVAGQGFYGLWGLANGSTIFVAPTGTNENDMGMGWPNVGGKDVAFTDAILAQVEADLCVDRSRVFATGWSWGAGMSYALACERASVLRGVAVYSAGEITSYTECAQGPVAYWAAHGVSDDVLGIATGRSMRDRFVSANGCTPQTPPEPSPGARTHLCTAYDGCSDGHPVTWCAFDGGHMWDPIDGGQASTWVPSQVWSFITGF